MLLRKVTHLYGAPLLDVRLHRPQLTILESPRIASLQYSNTVLLSGFQSGVAQLIPFIAPDLRERITLGPRGLTGNSIGTRCTSASSSPPFPSSPLLSLNFAPTSLMQTTIVLT